MTATVSPLEIAAAADELGAIVARIERDLERSYAAALAQMRAEFRAKTAETELHYERLVTTRLAALQDGPPGPPGEPAPLYAAPSRSR
jgi:hypothetical protein